MHESSKFTPFIFNSAGNYFYILIDRANEDKKTAVHFLNQVDEADLLALMEDENVKEEPAAAVSYTHLDVYKRKCGRCISVSLSLFMAV